MAVAPLSFRQVKDIVDGSTGKDKDLLGKLKRIREEQEKYDVFVTKVLLEYATIEDYILAKVFGSKAVLKSGRKVCEVCKNTAGRVVKWRENDFPYALESGIEHYILWSTESLTEEEIFKECESFSTKEYLFFVNPPKFRSVKRVWHAHVMYSE